MNTSSNPRDILDSMLVLLGFVCEVKAFPTNRGLTLQVYTADKDRLLARSGAVVDDLQLLVNRILQARDKEAPRVQVDVEHWREMQDDSLVQKVRRLAESVRMTGLPIQLEPMNGYERRIVHNAFKEDPDVVSWSPPDDARLKRITLRKRSDGGKASET